SDLAIEKKMAEISKRDLPVARKVMPRDQAVALFSSMGEKYKAEIIASIPEGETLSLYEQGDFIDLCRGPHVPSTGRLKVFKLMRVAGAYWRGDSKRSEEHTSELQSRENLVCRLLLEKKKNKHK